ncbi:MAG: NADH-quinone oxidoreductase subunit J [Tepidisphaeraceae bacterium]
MADAGSANYLIEPMVILVLCIAGGVGTLLLLPGRKQSPKLGGLLLIVAGLMLGLILFRTTVGRASSDIGPYFWIFSAIAVVGAIRVITHPRPVYSALYFVLTVFASAGLFILMYAEFIAAALVLIYAGAILITYVFVIMLAASAQTVDDRSPLAGLAECDLHSREPFTASCVGFALMGVLLFVIFDKAERLGQFYVSTPATGLSAEEQVHGSTQSIGQYLFQNQMVNFELAGLILTVSMVGAIIIARRRVADIDQRFEPSTETISANATPVDDDPRSIPVYGTTNPKQKSFPQT